LSLQKQKPERALIGNGRLAFVVFGGHFEASDFGFERCDWVALSEQFELTSYPPAERASAGSLTDPFVKV
jgi:hypothetical protein